MRPANPRAAAALVRGVCVLTKEVVLALCLIPLQVAGATAIASGQEITPLAYGAKCDGSTNDMIAIQSAANAAVGGTLVIPASPHGCNIRPISTGSTFPCGRWLPQAGGSQRV